MRQARLIAEFNSIPWAVLPETLQAMQMVLHRWASGARLSPEEIRAAVGDTPATQAARRDRERAAGGPMIGVLPVFGVIGHRASLVYDTSSGVNTSTELLSAAFRKMLVDERVSAIVLDIDSPGGSVYGVSELADEIYASRGQKRIVASVNSLAASAAYWIASAADEVVITPGGEAGSIGVWGAHVDASKYWEKEGLKWTLVSAGKYKVEGNEFGPLDDEARAFQQKRVDEYYDMFVKAVARNRRDTQTAVRNGYGEGRILGAEGAVKANLADRVGSFDQVLAELRRSATSPASRSQQGQARSVALARERLNRAVSSASVSGGSVALAKAKLTIAEHS
jgi:signal peptide peptidase SppA